MSTDRGVGASSHARRAVARWALRLFRREWRQQLLVLALLTVAVAATTTGLAVATNTALPGRTTFILQGSDPQLAADAAALQRAFGPMAAFAHQLIPVPGSVATVDVRAPYPGGPAPSKDVRVLAGRLPVTPGEVAVTHAVASTFTLHIGTTWQEGGRSLTVVGLVEDPRNLDDQFALAAAGQGGPPVTVTLQRDSSVPRLEPFRLPSGAGLQVEGQGAQDSKLAAVVVLCLSTIMLLFVGLVCVAGFTVMAQRRLRALGMLGSLGATDGHLRLVLLVNGAVVGLVGALAGTALGLASWLVLAPHLETVAGHRIDRFSLPWWAIGAAAGLAIVTSVAAAWWPARSASRVPVVTALSGRPPRPQPARRFAVLGGTVLCGGLVLLAFAHRDRPGFIVPGIVATSIGVLLLSPLAIGALGAAGRRWPVASRLAARDLARYQSRSGAALGAVTLAVFIATTIAASAAASQANDNAANRWALPANQLMVYASPDGASPLAVALGPAELRSAQDAVTGIAAALGTHDVLPLDVAVNPSEPLFGVGRGGPAGRDAAAMVQVTSADRRAIERVVGPPLYMATPEVLARYGITPRPGTDVLTSRTDLNGLYLGAGRGVNVRPVIQHVNLPASRSGPNSLITAYAVQRFGLQVVPAAWLVQAPHALTGAQIATARRLAAGAGLTIETTPSQRSLAGLRNGATAAGVLLALGVLAMTVGLIRSETANDLRTLTATGASAAVRRTLTGSTAASLAAVGALVGAGGAYLALLAWYRSRLGTLSHVPVLDLVAIVLGLPVAAAAGGWLLAGREPPAIARRPLD